MSGLLKDLSDIIESAKGNFFPTSHILRDALVVAKRIQDREFETFLNNELRGYKSGTLPQHRRIRGKVTIMPAFGPWQEVDLHRLDLQAARQVSTAYVADTVPIIESTINSQGEAGFFTVGLSRENGQLLISPKDGSLEYVIVLQTSQLREMLGEVRDIVLDWAIEREREFAAQSDGPANSVEQQNPRNKGALRYVSDNKQWIFSGIGVTLLVLAGGVAMRLIPWEWGKTAEQPVLITQREILEIPKLGDFEVFYPKPFSSIPNLTFNKRIGNVYIASDYQVLEQRKDGFKIRILSIADGRAIEWIAVGPSK